MKKYVILISTTVAFAVVAALLFHFLAARGTDKATAASQETLLAKSSHLATIYPPKPAAVTEEIKPNVKPAHSAPARIVELIEGRLGIPLSAHEAEVVDARLKELGQKREELELSLAKKEDVGPGKVYISIPKYPAEGQSLYQDFERELTLDLGAIAPLARSENSQLGQADQSILIEDQGDHFHIVRKLAPGADEKEKRTGSNIVSISDVQKTNLSWFTYLKPLFPKPTPEPQT
jgi:hypothetical protein